VISAYLSIPPLFLSYITKVFKETQEEEN